MFVDLSVAPPGLAVVDGIPTQGLRLAYALGWQLPSLRDWAQPGGGQPQRGDSL